MQIHLWADVCEHESDLSALRSDEFTSSTSFYRTLILLGSVKTKARGPGGGDEAVAMATVS